MYCLTYFRLLTFHWEKIIKLTNSILFFQKLVIYILLLIIKLIFSVIYDGMAIADIIEKLDEQS